jgi:putative hemolysin
LDEDSRSSARWIRRILISVCWVGVVFAVSGFVHGADVESPPKESAARPNLAEGATALLTHADALDTDDDGLLSYEEAQAGLTGMDEALFGKIDASGDQFLSKVELRRAADKRIRPRLLVGLVILLTLSAFFSASEVAYFSLSPLHIRAIGEREGLLNRETTRLLSQPGELLTSILMGNSIVNVLLGVVMAVPAETVFESLFPPPFSYLAAVVVCTAILVIVGEIVPKLLVVRNNELFARWAAWPLRLSSALLLPLRHGVLWLIGFLFRITGFSDLRPAPFMTDEEFDSLLSEGEATGAIEKDEREMIQGILKVSESMVREILIPRPDMIALSDGATVAEALDVVIEHEFARIPVCGENLDQIAGILYAKDLLSHVDQGNMELPIKSLLRPAHYVPETMTVSDFMKSVQRMRTHLAIVVDEFGGTEGLVTLHDALREIVRDLDTEDHPEDSAVVQVEKDLYEVDGRFPLDELEALTGVPVDDSEHTTVAGFLMEQSDKVPEVGDHIRHEGIRYTVEAVAGKRVSKLRIRIPAGNANKAGKAAG